MLSAEDSKAIGQTLIDKLRLRFSPIALKMIYDESKIPEGTPRPFRDTGNRLAMCQAYALVRRNRKSLTMLKDDHWCPWPIACFRICPVDSEDIDMMGTKLFMKDSEKSIEFFKKEFPWLETGAAPLGFAMAPLESSDFVPDIAIIYCRVAQLRTLIMAAKYQESGLFSVIPDTVASCCYATIPLLNGQEFSVTLPDPGEYERSLAGEDEIIFSARGDCLGKLMDGFEAIARSGFDYMNLTLDMNLNFPRAQFYNDIFSKWGLSTGDTWKPGER